MFFKFIFSIFSQIIPFILGMPKKAIKVTNAGGQAVIEGVMMRTKEFFVIAVRKSDGTIKLKYRKWKNIFPSFFKLPFLRGGLVLFEAMFNGIEALTWSFNESVDDENEKEKMGTFSTVSSIAVSFLFAMIIFVAIPHASAYFIQKYFEGASSIHSIAFHAIDGLIKIIIFTVYLYGISKMKDVKRLFKYHGAEHKSIYTLEYGKPLTVENARPFTTLHPRCGTSFMITVLIISILFFTLVFAFIPSITGNKIIDNLIYVAIKILLVFPISGISYELQRLASKFPDNKLITAIITPGLLYQHITTTEPEDDILEIGLVSLGKAIALEKKNKKTPIIGVGEETYENFEMFFKTVNREE
jgi:uncharacterized protein YqhQ